MLIRRVAGWLLAGWLLAGWLLSALAAAQYNAGDLVGVSTGGRLIRVTPGGVVHTYVLGTGTLSGWTMDYDNDNMLITDSTNRRLLLVNRNRVVTRAYNIPQYVPMNVAVDQNGDTFFTDLVTGGVIRFGGTTGGFHVVATSLASQLHGGLAVSIDSSDLLVTRGFGLVDHNPVFEVARDGRTVTSTRTGVYGRYGLAQTLDGTIWVGSCCRDSAVPRMLYRIAPGQSAATAYLTALPGTPLTGILSLAPDRASAPTDRLLLGAHPRQGFWIYDLTTGAVTRRAAAPADLFAVGFVGGRNVGAVKDRPRYWRLNISFPGEAGRPYHVAFSLAGVRPPLRLADGRRLWLRPDALTELTLRGPVPPFIQGNVGFLNARAQAYPILDLRSLPAALNGTRIWIAAATLDPAAPAGLGTVSDPMVLRIE